MFLIGWAVYRELFGVISTFNRLPVVKVHVRVVGMKIWRLNSWFFKWHMIWIYRMNKSVVGRVSRRVSMKCWLRTTQAWISNLLEEMHGKRVVEGGFMSVLGIKCEKEVWKCGKWIFCGVYVGFAGEWFSLFCLGGSATHYRYSAVKHSRRTEMHRTLAVRAVLRENTRRVRRVRGAQFPN